MNGLTNRSQSEIDDSLLRIDSALSLASTYHCCDSSHPQRMSTADVDRFVHCRSSLRSIDRCLASTCSAQRPSVASSLDLWNELQDFAEQQRLPPVVPKSHSFLTWADWSEGRETKNCSSADGKSAAAAAASILFSYQSRPIRSLHSDRPSSAEWMPFDRRGVVMCSLQMGGAVGDEFHKYAHSFSPIRSVRRKSQPECIRMDSTKSIKRDGR